MTRVLVVDDEPQILRTLAINLRARGYDVATAGDGAEALESAAAHPPDVVVLDLGLPDMDGAAVIEGLRGWSSVPILVLSGRSDSADKVDALDAGADDYVTKPFAMGELLARLRAVLRRAGQPGDPVIEIGELRLDLERSLVTVDGEQVHLTPREFRILRLLAQNEGKLLTHRTILREVWGPAYGDESNYLHVYLSQLRRKIEPDPTSPRYLLTEPGAGYRLVDPTDGAR